jgi:beta-lactamase superfamily II metal-dependent hydrolase
MMKLYAIQARFGDCFLLKNNEMNILIDGGPVRVYEEHLRPALKELLNGKNKLDAVIISHVDNDHIVGVLDLLTELQKQQDTKQPAFLTIGQVWFNSFSNTIGVPDLEKRMGQINNVASMNGVKMQEMSMALTGIKEGSLVTKRTKVLNIPLNPGTLHGFYLAGKNRQVIQLGTMEITVVGPTLDNLKKLQAEWEVWVKKNEQKIAEGKYTRDFAAAMDRSVPNLSSIVLLVKEGKKSILLTGDCRGDHLQQGLIETGLSADGRIHVTIFKVPHHGSMRNSSKKLFEEVTADTYIISADGTYNNPDKETLVWIVEAAKAAGRKIRLVFTNETPSVTTLLAEYSPAAYGYEAAVMDADWMDTSRAIV